MNIPPNEESTGKSRATTRWCWTIAGMIVLFGLGLRVAYYGTSGITDEVIAEKVVGHMRHSGDWDTNWAKADLPAGLRYDQYNFSSYYFATFLFYRLVKLLPLLDGWRSFEEGMEVYRMFSVLLAAIVVWLALQLARRSGGWAVGFVAALLTAVATQLVQDAHFARPESFTTVLTLGAVALCWPRKEFSAARVIGAALLIGLLVACKVSMLLLAWLPLVPWIAAVAGRPKVGVMLVAVPVALLAGFALGAPGAVMHPTQFIGGVKHLAVQYAGLHPPHSHLDGRPVADLFAEFFVATLGWPVLIASVVGGVVLVKTRRWAEAVLLIVPPAIFSGYFMTRSVFFERNVSHVLPLVLILAAIGVVVAAEFFEKKIRGPVLAWTTALTLLFLVQPLSLTVPLVWVELPLHGMERRGGFEDTLRAKYPDAVWRNMELLVSSQLEPLAEHFSKHREPLLIAVPDSHDEWTADVLRRLPESFQVTHLGDYPGSFPHVPVSTLVVYLSPDMHYYLVTGVRAPGR